MSGMAERMRINNTDHLDSQTIGQIELRYHILEFIVILRYENPVLAKHLRDESSHVLFPEDMSTRTSCLASFRGLVMYGRPK